ncbi:hypothetical protein PHYSODRAFT_479543 [Phytophthora sojae]|uniref:Uncharacterized protein n=1 Tax=Phytophthora sojae (strain P6497) TaxID=1094619 RepID=G4YXX8_PHYSP|nr:hypothetical protein PHYSODRAFT_479543 [Phytophthora sojae]EGZ25681.1 hypothetical protein PHYSODRAFT_479543 [Phytophthora sojae]|eukprot:XP_009520969.1 hypothetical protein PHYSODRAFT_479543 [Phytophthora sojae]
MGICRSSCANTSSLEYYDAWGHQVLAETAVPRPTPGSGCASTAAAPSAGSSTMLFQNYFKYVEVSPYVVLQDKTQQCDCVMCRGMVEASPPQRRWKDPFALKRASNLSTDGSLTDDEPERPESP